MTSKKTVITVDDSNSVCRLCLSKDNVSEIGFGDLDGGISLTSKIMTCVALVVSPNDLLSKFICCKCTEMLNVFFEFRETCLSAYVEQCHLLTKENQTTYEEHSYFETSAPLKERQLQTNSCDYFEADYVDDDETDDYDVEKISSKISSNEENCIIVVEPDEEQSIISSIDLLDDNAIIKETIEADGYFECEDCNAIFMTVRDLTGHVENNKCCNSEAKKDHSDSQKKNINAKRPKVLKKRLNETENFQSFMSERKRIGRTLSKKDLKCDVCGKEYKTAKGIVAHRRTHTGEKFSCPHCKSAFSDPYDLKYHLRIHSENPKYSCKYCKKGFRNPARVVIHERTHTNERPYVCDSCGKSFITIQGLRLHLRIHTGEKPYGCKYCDKKFRSIPSAVSHQKRHREGKRMFQCDLCLRMFETNEDLLTHTAQHKSMSVWRCRHCSLCFKKRSTLKTHIRDFHSTASKRKSNQSNLSRLVVEGDDVQHLSVQHGTEEIFMDSIQYEI